MKIFGNWASPQEAQLETPRCGRCAHVLPDETLSFCPYCGIPFSRVPPTTSFELLVAHREQVRLKILHRKVYATTVGLFLGIFLFLFGATELYYQNSIKNLSPMREVEFFFYDDTRYPSLTLYQKHQAIAVATESFQEHFGISLDHFRVQHGATPPDVARQSDWDWQTEKHTKLSYWEKSFYPEQQRRWEKNPNGPLQVFITNFPIHADKPAESLIETAHLSASQLVSGLGHPTFAIISVYRIFAEEEILFGKKQKILSELQSRYLGEYVIAHELGHAILGLPDYTVREREMPIGMRGPASQNLQFESRINYMECLMHSDTGGGYKAWSSLSQRKMDEKLKSYCPAYIPTIEAFLWRAKAIELLKSGDRASAERLHADAIRKLNETAEVWLTSMWKKEHRLFLNSFDRWFETFFYIGNTGDRW